MRALIVGYGSIGKRHLGNLRLLQPDAHITVLRHRISNESPPEGANEISFDVRAALEQRPDIALVCGPTTMHADVAVEIANTGSHLFIEKPLASSVADAERMVDAAAARDALLMVGYNLRFKRSLRAMKASLDAGEIGRPTSIRAEAGQYLPDWRPGSDYRQGNTARPELGGGLELELSHEFDYVRWLCGDVSAVSATLARTSDLEIATDDTAEVTLRFSTGIVGSVHLDITQRCATRVCRINGTDGTLVWDAIAGTVMRFRPGDEWQEIFSGEGDRNDTYLAELQHFLDCVAGKSKPLITGADGEQVVRIANAARQSAQEDRSITL